MKQLFEAMKRDPAVERLLAAVGKRPRQALLYGLGGSVKYAAFAACVRDLEGPLVVLVHGREAMNDWRDSLASLLPDRPVLLLPQVDDSAVAAEAKGLERAARRMDILVRLAEGRQCVVLADIEAGVQHDITPAAFRGRSITLKNGAVLPREQLLKNLVELGYSHADEVEHIGEFAARGGIVDIFPVNAVAPIRIEFFDDEVDSIRVYDVDTKRSRETVREAVLFPLARTMEKEEQHAPFFSFLQKGLLVFDEPARLREEIRRMVAEVPERKDTIFSWEQLTEAARPQTAVYSALMLQQIPGVESSAAISTQATQMTPFQRQLELFEGELGRWLGQKQTVVLLLSSKDKANAMHDMLAKQRIPSLVGEPEDPYSERAVNIRLGYLSSGFEMASARLVVVTEQDIFGRAKRRTAPARRSNGQGERIAHFRDIRPGDYVVHEAHGIGKYLGVETLEVGGVHKDYLHIKYGGDDKLFVPTDQVSLLQKYIGTEGEVPRLHRMGGTEWTKAKARAKKSVEDIAKKLIEIYAKRKNAKGTAFPPDDSSQREFEEAFPYQETEDQLKAIAQIKADMEKEKPMERLLCGDVGFGKTEVAIRAAYKAAMDGKQVAVLVPTTVLAQQHYQTFVARFQDFAPTVDVICRFRTAKQQRSTLEKVRLGQVDILIGTHAILNQKKVLWKDLGLLIVDEEQRFGVKQKEKIKSLADGIDVLTLSATPIPRTLHMSLVGARDMSVIETPPAERFPVQTYVVENSDAIIANAIKRELRRGGQVYFVYNRVDTIDHMRRRLEALVPEARIMTAHGQMSEKLLEKVMMDFYEGAYDVLLATSIIENGLDIANANTILVYNADHFGLSQLYQMRGRVGRSHHMAFAYFIYQADKVLTETAEKRLQAMKDFAELGAGFKIAMRDLEIRGAGNLLGAQQHGHIASVGFEMYVKLLEEAVERLRQGEKAEDVPPEPYIDMTVDAYIDSDYISDAMHKLEVYRRIVAIRDNEEIPALIDELIDRFGEPTKPVMRLLAIARIKNYARRLSLKTVQETPGAVSFYLLPGKKLPTGGLLALDHFFGRSIKSLPEQAGFRITLPPKWQKDILNVVTRTLMLASEEEGAMEKMEERKEANG